MKRLLIASALLIAAPGTSAAQEVWTTAPDGNVHVYIDGQYLGCYTCLPGEGGYRRAGPADYGYRRAADEGADAEVVIVDESEGQPILGQIHVYGRNGSYRYYDLTIQRPSSTPYYEPYRYRYDAPADEEPTSRTRLRRRRSAESSAP